MEAFFENKFICTKDYYTEYYKYIYFKKPLIIIINLILCIGLLINVLSIIFPDLLMENFETSVANIASILVIWCVEIYVFVRNKDLAYKKDLEKNKGNPTEMQIVVTKEDIDVYTNTEKISNIDFKNIEKTVKTKNYYILISKAKLGIALKKDGFTKGTQNQFEEFLRKKNLFK